MSYLTPKEQDASKTLTHERGPSLPERSPPGVYSRHALSRNADLAGAYIVPGVLSRDGMAGIKVHEM